MRLSVLKHPTGLNSTLLASTLSHYSFLPKQTSLREATRDWACGRPGLGHPRTGSISRPESQAQSFPASASHTGSAQQNCTPGPRGLSHFKYRFDPQGELGSTAKAEIFRFLKLGPSTEPPQHIRTCDTSTGLRPDQEDLMTP